MSSLFLNGLYTYAINAISSTNNLLLGGTNTNNIQILSPIISNNLTFNYVNTTDIINTISENFCFNSNIPSASISITNNSTTKNTNIILDASNIIFNSPIITNYGYDNISGTNIKGTIGYSERVYCVETNLGNSATFTGFDSIYITKGIWIVECYMFLFNPNTVNSSTITRIVINGYGTYDDDSNYEIICNLLVSPDTYVMSANQVGGGNENAMYSNNFVGIVSAPMDDYKISFHLEINFSGEIRISPLSYLKCTRIA